MRGPGLEDIREIRSVVAGKTTDHVIGRPTPAQEGMSEPVQRQSFGFEQGRPGGPGAAHRGGPGASAAGHGYRAFAPARAARRPPGQDPAARKNSHRVTDVRIRKEGEEPRYRGRHGQLPFRRLEEGGGLEVDVVAGRTTPLGSRYVIDLLVEQYRAVSVPMEIGIPLPCSPAPVVETREPGAPRVIELPALAP